MTHDACIDRPSRKTASAAGGCPTYFDPTTHLLDFAPSIASSKKTRKEAQGRLEENVSNLAPGLCISRTHEMRSYLLEG